MTIVESLPPTSVVDLQGTTAREVLEELCAAAPDSGLERQWLLVGLLAREAFQPTTVAGGLALPHCRLEGVDRLTTAFGRSRAGVPFGDPGGPTHLFFALFTPTRPPRVQLEALARVSRLLGPDEFRARLLAEPTPAEMYRAIAERDASLGGTP